MAARKPARSRKPARAGRPAWVLLVAGVVIGLGVGGLAWLASVKLPADKPAAGAAAAKPAPKAAKPKAEPVRAESPDYTFYTVLPRNETRVPDQDSKAAGSAAAANEVYVLQVGSFKQAADADRRRAELILMGLDTYVEKVTLNNGETWNRVLVGPFGDSAKANAARETLAANKVDSMLLKRQTR